MSKKLKKDHHSSHSDSEKLYEKFSKLSGRLSGVSIYLDKLEREKRQYIEEKDRMIHRIHQLELDLKTQQELGSELSMINNEYCSIFFI